MTRKYIPLRAVLFGVLGIAASALTISVNDLLERGGTCPADYSKCPQKTLPSGFCCPAGQQCLALAGNTTLLCCPDDSGCTTIVPISCELSLQDADKYPEATIKTTALHGILGHCGDGTCCPFGYSCSADGSICQLDANQNAKPLQSSLSPTPASTSAASTSTKSEASSSATGNTAGGGQSSGASAGVTPVSPEATDSPKKGTPAAVIAGASVAAVLVVLALAFVAFLFFKRRHRKKEDEMANLKLTRSTSSFGNIISNPIMTENSTWRTDFARKSPEGTRAGSMFSKRSSTTMIGSGNAGYGPSTPSPARTRDNGAQAAVRIPPIRNMARQSSIAYGYGGPGTSPYGNTADNRYDARDHGTAPYPQTPPPQGREPSSMSINVFADPQTVGNTPQNTKSKRFSHMTTFSDMLRSADLGGFSHGEPFVPPSANASPASRRW
ncbi:hypothetical protein QBC33DRAFT_328801 [Phialemonium atrogriseum]|uniref:Mid2 domain-containing protein n=1 Tax=Phialemonium atrogriseum TaxID=1093897 RepID=A0AAJ0C3T7_9PEZI|nr:uncharacterized protein QBC33DRAFT_328801 [Phialemonium atrogriseum]KAK1769629.1 hypothetical protein QBC33DRAFT_328801 [Phialemonium atrogriseum]